MINQEHIKSIFNQIGFDSATISPYMGIDSVMPFLEDSKDRCYRA